MSVSEDDFDEEKWDQDRVELEEKVINSIYALANYMGCNSFTLPTTLMDIKVLITSRQVNALLD